MSIIGFTHLQELTSDDCEVLARFAKIEKNISPDLAKFAADGQAAAVETLANKWLENVYTEGGVFINYGVSDYALAKLIVAYQQNFMTPPVAPVADPVAEATPAADTTDTDSTSDAANATEAAPVADPVAEATPAADTTDTDSTSDAANATEAAPVADPVAEATPAADTTDTDSTSDAANATEATPAADPAAESAPVANTTAPVSAAPAAAEATPVADAASSTTATTAAPIQPKVIQSCDTLLGGLNQLPKGPTKALWEIYKHVETESIADVHPYLSLLVTGATGITSDALRGGRLCADILPGWGDSAEAFVNANLADAQAALDHVSSLLSSDAGICGA